MSASFITIGICSYNTDVEHVADCVQSIAQQTYAGKMQVVWVDDGSDDCHGRFVRTCLLSLKPRFITTYIRHPRNRGLGAARKSIVDNAIGKLVCIVDSDDIQSPFRIAAQAAYMNKNPQIMACGMQMQQFRDGEPLGDTTLPTMTWAQYVDNPVHFFAAHPTMMYRRKALLEVGNYNAGLRYLEDFDLHVRLLKQFHTIVNLPYVGMYYRIHPNQSTRKFHGCGCHEAQHALIGYYCYGMPISGDIFVVRKQLQQIIGAGSP